MKRILITAAALALLAGPAFAQTAMTPATSNDETVLDNSTMNNNDAALPGGPETNTMGTGTTTGAGVDGTESTSSITGAPQGSGNSSQPAIVPGSEQGQVESSTPSDGVVPGQDPE